MDNSLVTHLQAGVAAMFKDMAYTYTRTYDWRRDQQRLLHELAFHGARVALLDMPALAKHLDKCLDQGLYVASSLTLGSLKSSKIKVPALFGNLYLQIFDSEGKLRVAPCKEAIVALRTALMHLKKMRLQCTIRSVNDEVKKFIAIEKETRSPTYSWSDDHLDFDIPRPHFVDVLGAESASPSFPGFESPIVGVPRESLALLQQVCDRVSSQFGDLHNEGISERPKHGPGATANQRGGMSKFRFQWWSRKLESVFPYDLYAVTDFGVGSDHDREVEWGRSHEHPSRLIAVPKTLKAPRLIAAEPVEHQWIQQLVRNQLETRLLWTPIRSSVLFRSQRTNQDWAIAGSRDGGLATVDLSSASDRLSCWTVERAFRANRSLLERLHAGRTRWLSNEVCTELGRYMVLKKFAAQGSAVTFPVQSIVYACIAVSALLITENRPVTYGSIQDASRRVQVFGDDIIVPKECLSTLVALLHCLGLKVNTDKTYGTGKFRESCGVDAYDGTDVSSPYLTSPAINPRQTEIEALVQVANNYFRKGWWHTSEWVRSTLSEVDHLIPVVNHTSHALGWAS